MAVLEPDTEPQHAGNTSRTDPNRVVPNRLIAGPTAGQSPVGPLAIDERRGDQWGWAVDYETASAAQSAALRECGVGCSVVLTFRRCGTYAADQDTGVRTT